MKSKILEIITEKPKHYSRIIKDDPVLYNWVLKNKKTNNKKISAQIYSAIYDVDDVCEYGNIKKFDRWSTGFVGCGPASVCECTKNNISKNVSKAKNNISENDKIKINDKRKLTMLEKYGVEYNSQRPDIKPILKKQKIENEKYNYLNNYNWMYSEYIEKKRTSVDIALELNVHYSTVIEYLKKLNFTIRKNSNYSLQENQIKEYIKSSNIDIIEHDRNILNGKEIDILIPEKNLAIEMNGLYWHSYGKNDIENKNYHLEKKQICLENGINLFHITDYEWKYKTEIIKSMINSKLNITNKIYARKCNIVELDSKTARLFFDNNHLNGFIGSSNYIGLEYDNNIVMCMSFGKNRFNDGIELHRMASVLNTTVVGGSSKILKYYIEKYNVNKIHTYCDFSHSDGSGYKNIGFILKGITQPNYYWTDGNQIISRYKTRHTTNLKKIVGDIYDKSLSERDNMMNAGYKRYWGCGHLIFEYNK